MYTTSSLAPLNDPLILYALSVPGDFGGRPLKMKAPQDVGT